MISGEDDEVLLQLLELLSHAAYRFTTPTPETHRRVLGRAPETVACDLRDAFGWNRMFEDGLLPPALLNRLRGAGWVHAQSGRNRSRVRVATVGERLFLHSAYPTTERDSVFFGPDSNRFVQFLERQIGDGRPVRHLVDVGAGAGVGAISAARLVSGARLTLTDINPLALRFARINARHAGVAIEALAGDGIEPAGEGFDLAVMNPPFIVDSRQRAYRHGGDMHGAELSLAWASAAAARLAAGGRILLYTGSAIVAGTDQLQLALGKRLAEQGCTVSYTEIDPDIFGEELDQPAYLEVERIAAVGVVITKPA
jgi:methylase of polypeptide subunit release factors